MIRKLARVAAALRALFTLVLVLVLGAAPVRASMLEELYAKRLMFSSTGEPLVPIGMMQGRARVELTAGTSLVVEIDDTRETIAAGTSVVVERISGTTARVRDLLVVDTLEGKDRRDKRARIDAWRARGIEVAAYDVGGVYGVKGTVVDNRAVVLALVAPPSKLPDDVRPVPLEWLDAMPTVRMRVTLGASVHEGSALHVRPTNDGAVLVKQVEHSVGYAAHGFADRQLRQDVWVVADKAGMLAVVNVVDEDVLVAGVLPSEMFASAPLEALKAQAVTARGELFAKVGRRHFGDPFLVCSEQHCQVYQGLSAETPRTNEAARTTRGELAFVDDKLVDSVYSACCGGHTEPADVVWDRPPSSALRGVPDTWQGDPSERVDGSAAAFPVAMFARASHEAGGAPIPIDLRRDDDVRAFLALPRSSAWCGSSSMNQKGDAWRWSRRFTREQLDAAFASLHVGTVQRFVVEERGPGGRLRSVRIEGSDSTARILRELPVRKALGNLRSGLFVVDEERDESGALVAITLRGAGFGHGSGMCQQGAIGMAEAGFTYREILRHYYAGAEVRRVF